MLNAFVGAFVGAVIYRFLHLSVVIYWSCMHSVIGASWCCSCMHLYSVVGVVIFDVLLAIFSLLFSCDFARQQ